MPARFATGIDAAIRLLLVVWVGALLGTGGIAAPVLFDQLADRVLAGNLAGRMFALAAQVGFVCGVLSLCLCWLRRRERRNWPLAWIVATMLLLGGVGHLYVQPRIVAIKQAALPLPVDQTPLRAEFGRWHAVSSMLFGVQLLLGLGLLARPAT